MMNYNQLPKTITSPFTGETLHLMPLGFPNESDFSVHNHIITDYGGGSSPDCGSWLIGPVAMYCVDSKNWGRTETIFVPVN